MNPFERITYFEDLSKSHSFVAHDADILNDAHEVIGKRKSFLEDIADEVPASELLKLDFPCCVADIGDGKIVVKDGQNRNRYVNKLRFLSKYSILSESDPSIPKSKKVAWSLTYEVMMDYLNKIQSDYEDTEPCGDFKFIDENSYYWEKVERVGSNMCGWDLFFNDEEPANFSIDETKWS